MKIIQAGPTTLPPIFFQVPQTPVSPVDSAPMPISFINTSRSNERSEEMLLSPSPDPRRCPLPLPSTLLKQDIANLEAECLRYATTPSCYFSPRLVRDNVKRLNIEIFHISQYLTLTSFPDGTETISTVAREVAETILGGELSRRFFCWVRGGHQSLVPLRIILQHTLAALCAQIMECPILDSDVDLVVATARHNLTTFTEVLLCILLISCRGTHSSVLITNCTSHICTLVTLSCSLNRALTENPDIRLIVATTGSAFDENSMTKEDGIEGTQVGASTGLGLGHENEFGRVECCLVKCPVVTGNFCTVTETT